MEADVVERIEDEEEDEEEEEVVVAVLEAEDQD